jgi:hypothetical protein
MSHCGVHRHRIKLFLGNDLYNGAKARSICFNPNLKRPRLVVIFLHMMVQELQLSHTYVHFATNPIEAASLFPAGQISTTAGSRPETSLRSIDC